VEKARRKSEVWEIVNRERRKRKKVNENIEMENIGMEGAFHEAARRSRRKSGKAERDIGREELKER